MSRCIAQGSGEENESQQRPPMAEQAASTPVKENAVQASAPVDTGLHRASTARFSCRRWRHLKGNISDRDTTKPTPPVARRPPPKWCDGDVTMFPSAGTKKTSAVVQWSKTPPPTGRDSLSWKAIDRYDANVTKKLLDKAYNTGDSKTQPSPPDYRELVHNQVYLPSVHRTIEYLHKPRPATMTTPRTEAASTPRTPLGTKLLSSQLRELQAELLHEYEMKRATTTPIKVWSPRPPPPQLSSSASSSSSSSMRSNRGNRVHSHSVTPPCGINDAASDGGDERQRVLVLTDSETCSLSSGIGIHSDMQAHSDSEPPSTGTQSWSSFESHVITALEVSRAVPIGSMHEPLIVSCDSDDVALRASKSESKNRTSTVSIASSPSSGVAEDHVVFVDNGVRVNSLGQVIDDASGLLELIDANDNTGDEQGEELQRREGGDQVDTRRKGTMRPQSIDPLPPKTSRSRHPSVSADYTDNLEAELLHTFALNLCLDR